MKWRENLASIRTERSAKIDAIVQSFPLYYNLDSHYKQQCVFDDKKKPTISLVETESKLYALLIAPL